MKHLRIISIIVLLKIINIYPQVLPDFMVANTNIVTSYFSMFSFHEIESEKNGNDYLFTDQVRPRQNDTIITDTLFFGINQMYSKMRIKKVSLSRNGIVYFSIDSFPICDTLKWKLVNNFRADSILLRDSLLDIKISSKTAILRLCLDKKYTIVKNDVFKIVLDTIPLHIIVGIKSRQANAITNLSFNNTVKYLYINQHYSFNESGLCNAIFNLAGKKHFKNNSTSSIYISKK